MVKMKKAVIDLEAHVAGEEIEGLDGKVADTTDCRGELGQCKNASCRPQKKIGLDFLGPSFF